MTFDDLLAAAAVKEPPALYVMAHSDGGYTTNVPVADLVGGKGMIATRYNRATFHPRTASSPAACSTSLLLEKRQMGAEIAVHGRDEHGFWESFGYHNHGDPWKEQRYDGD